MDLVVRAPKQEQVLQVQRNGARSLGTQTQTFKAFQGPGRWLRQLVHNHEDLSSNPQHSRGKLHVAADACDSSREGRGDMKTLEAHWPASQKGKGPARWDTLSCVRKVETNRGSSGSFCMHAHRHGHLHTYAHTTHTCSHMHAHPCRHICTTHVHVHTLTCTLTHTSTTLTYICTHTYTHSSTYAHAHSHIYIQNTCTHVYTPTHPHSTHMCMHTHGHKCTCITHSHTHIQTH